MMRTKLITLVPLAICATRLAPAARGAERPAHGRDYRFNGTMSREMLEDYLSRSITMEGLLNGRGDLDDNIRMLETTGAKFIGRSLCLWGGEANLLSNLQRAKQQSPRLHQADPDMILQACIFEIVTTQVDQVPVPDWAFVALGQPVEKRNFRYADMLYSDGRFKDHWRAGNSVPDRPQEAVLKVGFSDGIYGRSKGGMTFSGWKCEHLPYLVEIDNWGVSRRPGQPRAGGIWIWGYDEITWFAHQSKQYRADWLRYAWDWVRQADPNGYLQMPGSRTLRSPLDGMRWYYANTPSPAVPEGLGDEEAIRAIWAADSESHSN